MEGLRGLGHEAEILDHDCAASRVGEHRLSLRPTLPTPVTREDAKRYGAKIRAFAEPLCHLPRSRPVSLDRIGDLEPYDAVVVGSDEVWNLRHPLFGGRVAFFGVGLPARRVVSYAASFGGYSCWEGLGAPWTELLGRFDAISVRDENSWWMLRHALGIEAPLVLDPCLQFPGAEPEAGTPLAGAYLLVYGHNFSEGFARRTRDWAHAKGLRVVSVGYRNDWADESWIEAGPLEFAAAVAGAACVATNFFHGAVFALRGRKPFACETSEYRAIKMRGLLEAVGGEAHLVTEATPEAAFGGLLCAPVAPGIFDRIEALRGESRRYLDEALG